MRTLEVRRHSWTRKDRHAGDPHLSPAGVRLAQRIGGTLPPMSYVTVGDQPRHVETAVAMGYAVDEQAAWPSGYVEGEVRHHDQWSWDAPYARYAEILGRGGGLAAMAEEHLAHWRRVLTRVPDGGAALVVSSGGSIEPVLVAAFPGADHGAWGQPLHHLEGATLTVDGDAFVALELRRRPRSRVVLMCGPAGSGKSTYARGLEADGLVRLSFDAEMWRRGITTVPLPPDVRADIEADLRERLLGLVVEGRDVVLDFSFWSRAMRDDYRRLLGEVGVVPETVYLATDRDTVLARVRERRGSNEDDFVVDEETAAAYVDQFEPPTPDEGPLTVVGG